ncbi:Hint domain-containing protein [Aestuariibius sp. 2305UL40-4]|uniref:Hint domain-containing protein n=1 Tax=Aestuariibius violaceus TaxID=3234132 RepID=UPI00346B8DB5
MTALAQKMTNDTNDCFHTLAEGTRVLTPKGPVAVEALTEGMEIHTKGGQTGIVRSVTRRNSVDAPIRFDQGAIGNTEDLVVAPWQRVLVTGFQAEILYGQSELLVPAADLVDGDAIHRGDAGQVAYLEIELDGEHTIIAGGATVTGSMPAPRTQTPAEQLPNVRSIFSGKRRSFGAGGIATA